MATVAYPRLARVVSRAKYAVVLARIGCQLTAPLTSGEITAIAAMADLLCDDCPQSWSCMAAGGCTARGVHWPRAAELEFQLRGSPADSAGEPRDGDDA